MTTLNLQVNVSANDGQKDGTSFFNNRTFIGIGAIDGTVQSGYFRFVSVTGLAPGVTITAATLQELDSGGSDGATGVLSRFYADDSAAPTAPTTAATYDSKTRTTAFVNWNTTGWTASAWNTSPSLVSIIQELADSYTVTAIQIFHQNNATPDIHYLDIRTYDHNTANGAKLDITYTAAASGILRQMMAHHGG